jgi:capsular polysaccharide transport system permease protein
MSLSSYQATLAVWSALFLRETSVRMFGSRLAWVWLVAEPLANVLWLITVFTVVKVRHVGGISTALWIATGMLVFMTFRRTVGQVQNAVASNAALFAYRQVRPADVALVRAAVEGFTMLLISMAVFVAGGFMGWMEWPHSMWRLLEAFTLSWLCALGLGMCFGVLIKLLPEMERIVNFIMTPLMMVSGVIFPLSMVQEPYLGWLLLNPLAHAIEAVRTGFAPYYHAVQGMDIGYMYGCALVLVVCGLGLFRALDQRLVMR